MLMGPWKVAQLFFAVCITVALFSRSPFGFPFMIVGFWKFGFPETMGCYRRCFRIGKVSAESISAFLDGVGTLIHHTTGSYWIIACTTGLQPFDRRILSLSLPLVGQHIVVLTRYVNTPLYGICELCLEVFWEIEVFSNLDQLSLENGYDISTRGAALCMLLAHWCYWSAAIIGAFAMLLPNTHALREIEKLATHVDGSGMDVDEFLKVVKQKEIPIGEDAAKALFRVCDKDGSGSIDSDEMHHLFKMLKAMFPDIAEKKVEAEAVFEAGKKTKTVNHIDTSSIRVNELKTASVSSSEESGGATITSPTSREI
uniref:EF-hand domain-containing protein n=1 Tax=Haptolina ericina TaxID=156174 RepID=A0A7S3BHW4_9EUKA